MQDELQELLHVLWIGGATDCGKSTVAKGLAERHDLQLYHYDQRDLAHHEQLALTNPAYRAFLEASLDERWITPEPEELFRRSLKSFRDRFPLVLDDLKALPRNRKIVAEGFGLLPELLAPILCQPAQAIWLAPSEDFKLASMTRRGKPSFVHQVSDPERAKSNLFQRDRLLTEHIQKQVLQYGYIFHEVDGIRSPDQMVDFIEQHFAPFLFD